MRSGSLPSHTGLSPGISDMRQETTLAAMDRTFASGAIVAAINLAGGRRSATTP